eukprot:PLAT15485.1.p1 GENE.PLAT15485.1~~PLAT15485.1.p1  ORF type:complete len:1512 (+),score=637.60 PLAT15485.1:352-4536(+)
MFNVAGDMTMEEESAINTTARASFDTVRAGVGYDGAGASHAGCGGLRDCDASTISTPCQSTYGDIYLSDFGNAMGSSSVRYDRGKFIYGSAGGGRINVTVAGTFTLLGKLLAAGGAAVELGGGAGGGVFVQADGIMGSSGIIDVRGGDGAPGSEAEAHGPQELTYMRGAGGGGRIVLRYGASGLGLASGNLAYAGGTSAASPSMIAGCGGGGAGTFMLQQLSTASTSPSNRLQVSNGGRATVAYTPLPQSSGLFAAPIESIKASGALLALNLLVTTGVLELSAAARLSPLQANNEMLVKAATLSLAGQSSLTGQGKLSVFVERLEQDGTSAITFTGAAVLNCTLTAKLLGKVEGASATSSLRVLATDSITTGSLAISAGRIHFNSAGSIAIAGDVTAQATDCGSLPQLLSCAEVSRFASSAAAKWGNYTVILSGAGDVDVRPTASVGGSYILLCSSNTVDVEGSISASSLGCPPGAGIGAGGENTLATGSSGGGGGHGGAGGVGLGGNLTVAGGVAYGNGSQPLLPGSGGGSNTNNGGPGGGVVLVQSPLLLMGELGVVTADGVDGAANSGGGSGGSIFVDVGSLSGDGAFSVRGGAGGVGGGGGGGGGRIAFLVQQVTKLASSFSGTYHVEGGPSGDSSEDEAGNGQDGTILGPHCPPGYGGLFCAACSHTQYKAAPGPQACLPCKNKPESSRYLLKAGQVNTAETCHFVCDRGLHGPHCLSSLALFVNSLGGPLAFSLGILGLMLGIAVVVCFGCRRKGKSSGRRRRTSSSGGSGKESLLAAYSNPLQQNRLTERELARHVWRVAVAGSNSPESPWHFPTRPPAAVAAMLDRKEWKDFMTELNEAVRWSGGMSFMLSLLRFLCYPLYELNLEKMRKERSRTVRDIMLQYDHKCMLGPRARSLQNSLMFSHGPASVECHLDILCDPGDDPPATPTGQPRFPLVLLFAGNGSYAAPFMLDASDVLVRSVPNYDGLTCFIDDKWVDFVADVNCALRQLRPHRLRQTAFTLLSLLRDVNSRGDYLGGLQVQLGKFWPHGQRGNWEAPAAASADGFRLGFLINLSGGQPPPQPLKADLLMDEAAKLVELPMSMDSPMPSILSRLRDDALYGPLSDSTDYDDVPGLDDEDDDDAARSALALDPPALLYPSEQSKGAKRGHHARGRSIRDEALMGKAGDGAGALSSGHGGSAGGIDDEGRAWLPFEFVLYADEKDILPPPPRERLRRLLDQPLLRNTLPLRRLRVLQLAMLVLYTVDLLLTFIVFISLSCIASTDVSEGCKQTGLWLLLLCYPLVAIATPLMGLIVAAFNLRGAVRTLALCTLASVVNATVALLVAVVYQAQLTNSVTLLAAMWLITKIASVQALNYYLADVEMERRHPGWRGLAQVYTGGTSAFFDEE